jgi:hypothetical protein
MVCGSCGRAPRILVTALNVKSQGAYNSVKDKNLFHCRESNPDRPAHKLCWSIVCNARIKCVVTWTRSVLWSSPTIRTLFCVTGWWMGRVEQRCVSICQRLLIAAAATRSWSCHDLWNATRHWTGFRDKGDVTVICWGGGEDEGGRRKSQALSKKSKRLVFQSGWLLQSLSVVSEVHVHEIWISHNSSLLFWDVRPWSLVESG